jgi:hypothetical protein
LQPRRKSLVVAFDHALVLGPISGTEHPANKCGDSRKRVFDVVLLNLGLMQRCPASLLAPAMPGIIARIVAVRDG